MNNHKTISIIVTTALGIYLFGLLERQTPAPKPTKVFIQKASPSTIEQELDKLETDTWSKVTQATGVTRADIIKRQQLAARSYKRSDLKQRSSMRKKGKLSRAMVQLFNSICHEYGIDTNQVEAVPFANNGSPACATDYTVYIDEEYLTTYPEKDRRFIVAHELAHIKRKDSSFHSAIIDIVGPHNQESLEHQLTNVRERRADLQALKLSPEYADAGISYFSYLLKRDGDCSFPTHPSARERLEMARAIQKSYQLA